jgi:hypothetical protein
VVGAGPATCSLDTFSSLSLFPPFFFDFFLSNTLLAAHHRTLFQHRNQQIPPPSHPDCTFRDTIFLFSLSTQYLYSPLSGPAGPVPPYPFASPPVELVSLLCLHFGLAGAQHWIGEERNKLWFSESASPDRANIYERKKLSELRHMGSAFSIFLCYCIDGNRKRLHLQFASPT